MTQNEFQMTPQQRAQHIMQMLQQAQQECRVDIERMNDPKAQALFETIAEVLGGAMKALSDYQAGNESAWQTSTQSTQQQDSIRQKIQPPYATDMAVDIDEVEPPPHLHTEVPPQ